MKLGIALSGGGIRGIAHAGVLQALEEIGIKPDIIAGTSCGSMVSVMYAMGYSPYHIYILFKRYAKTIAKTNSLPIINGIRNYIFDKKALTGFNSGEKIEEVYDMVARRREICKVDEIKMPLAMPSVDIITGKEVVFTNCLEGNAGNKKIYINDISVGRAIRGSSSFPRVF